MSYLGYKHTAEARAKMSETRRLSTCGVNNGFYGKHHTEAWKKERSLLCSGSGNSMYGHKREGTYSAETRYKMGSGYRGRKQSPEFVARRTATLKGRMVTAETREKISQSHRVSPRCQACFFPKGKANPSWVGGRSFEVYGEAFCGELKDSIRARDSYTCQLCFRVENGRRHTCHHIDYCKQHTVPENLVTLCTPCNNRVNQNRLFWQAHFTSLLKTRGLIQKGWS